MNNTQSNTYPLRLPHAIKSAVKQLAKEEGISLNQFVATVVAEKLTALNTAKFFSEMKNRADFIAFLDILTRESGAHIQWKMMSCYYKGIATI